MNFNNHAEDQGFAAGGADEEDGRFQAQAGSRAAAVGPSAEGCDVTVHHPVRAARHRHHVLAPALDKEAGRQRKVSPRRLQHWFDY